MIYFDRHITFRLGSAVFFGQGSHAGSPEGFGIARGAGFFDGVDSRREQTARMAAPGAHAKEGFEDSRVITWRGQCVASTPRKLMTYRNQLAGLVSQGYMPLHVEYANDHYKVDRVAFVTQPTFEPFGYLDRARYSVKLWAPDPWFYGPSREFGATTAATIYHRGNTNAYPVITVSGTFPNGFSLVAGDGGGSCSTKTSLTGIFTIDMRNMRVLTPGGNQRAVMRGTPLKIAPYRDTWLSIGAPGGDGYIAKTVVRDTYI